MVCCAVSQFRRHTSSELITRQHAWQTEQQNLAAKKRTAEKIDTSKFYTDCFPSIYTSFVLVAAVEAKLLMLLLLVY